MGEKCNRIDKQVPLGFSDTVALVFILYVCRVQGPSCDATEIFLFHTLGIARNQMLGDGSGVVAGEGGGAFL
jgi:hypothetical protein